MRLAARGSAAQETSTCMSERGETLNVEGARSGLFGVVASRMVFTPNGRRVMVTSLPFLTGNRMGRSFSRRSVSVAAATLPIKGSATLAVVAGPWGSDLGDGNFVAVPDRQPNGAIVLEEIGLRGSGDFADKRQRHVSGSGCALGFVEAGDESEIGRESCRERAEISR